MGEDATPEDAGQPEAEIPWAMQFALRVEKVDPPSDLEACEAVAQACVAFIAAAEGTTAELDDPDGTEETRGHPEWREALETWRGVAIRKIVRRCRGKRWSDAQHLPGVTARVGRAEARAFVPAPTSPLPPELAKMQVEGTELPAADEASARDDAFVTVRLSPLVTMTSGKSAAQCAHAAQRAYEAMTAGERERFARTGFRVHAVRDTREDWAARPGRVSIVDAGFTELDGQHETARAEW